MKASLFITSCLCMVLSAVLPVRSGVVEELGIYIDSVESGRLGLRAEMSPSFTNRVEFYACDTLVSNTWQLVSGQLTGAPSNKVSWTDTSSLSSQPSRFYRVGNADWDSDGDTIPDARELIIYATSPNRSDTDFDQVDDAVELSTPGLDPLDPDSDGDGIPDGEELRWGYSDPTVPNVLSSDTDGDQLSFIHEYSFGTNPGNPDSDGDGVWDGLEVGQGSNPSDFGDGGVPPASNDLAQVLLSIVDVGGGAEQFVLRMGPVRILSGTGEQSFLFSKGWKYDAEVVLAGVAEGSPDSSYNASIQGAASNTVFISDVATLQSNMPVDVFVPEFEYSIYVDQPVPGDRTRKYLVISYFTMDLFVGHSWWQLRVEPAEFIDRFVEDTDRARFLNITTGFYPAGYPDSNLSKSQQSTAADVYSPEVFFSADVVKSFPVMWPDLLKALDYVIALNASPGIFDLSLHNCSDVALEVAALCGHILPDSYGSWPSGGGTNPADLGEDLRAMP